MKRLLVSLLLIAPAMGLHAANPATAIAVYTYNFGEVPGDVLVRATQEVSRIYNRAGIALEWVDCPTRPGLEEQYPRCIYAVASPRLELRLLSRAIAERMGLDPTVFGVALHGQNGRLGSTAYAVIGAEIELWQGCNLDRGAVLGHLMAHELGHLLLGERSHAVGGIMGVPWGTVELTDLAAGLLLFTPQQARRMQAQIGRREELAWRVAQASALTLAANLGSTPDAGGRR